MQEQHTAELTKPAPPTTPALVEVEPVPFRSSLPDEWHETMKLKLQGVATKEIARRMQCDRTTVYRRCEAVKAEYLTALEGTPKLNIIAESLQRLELIYAKAMQEHDSSASGRVRDASLNTARRAANDMMSIYLQTGIVERAPDRHYQTVLQLKPSDLKPEGQEITKTREETIAELIDALQKSPTL